MKRPEAENSVGLAATGIAGLDAILEGGLPRHRIYLILGQSGTGKTTLALQFSLQGLRNKERTLYFTLAETEEELHQVASSHGWSLDGIDFCELATVGKGLQPEEQYTLFHPSEVELGESIKHIQDEVERVQPTRVVVDSLTGLRLLAEDPLRYRRQMEALRRFLVSKACTVLLLDEDILLQDDFQTRSLAHGIIQLEQLVQEYGADRRRLRIVKLRGVAISSGYHDFKIVPGGVVVYPRLVAMKHYNEITRDAISSGLNELDILLQGGLVRGNSALLMGPAGSGKSSLAARYAVAAAQRGEASTFYVFDEDIDTFITRLASIGMDIKPHIEKGLIYVHKIDPTAMSPSEFAYHIRERVEQNQVRLVVIDSIGGYLHAMPQEHYLHLHVHELLAYLNRQGVIALIIMVQHGLLGAEIKTPADLSSIVDTVILLRFFEANGEVRQSIAVIKKRSGGHEHTIREFRIGPDGVSVGEPLREFHGVLTGTPRYIGSADPLLDIDS